MKVIPNERRLNKTKTLMQRNAEQIQTHCTVGTEKYKDLVFSQMLKI